jgi:chromosome segregation ATPase
MAVRIAQPPFEPAHYYKPSAHDITISMEGLSRHRDLMDIVMSASIELQKREIADKAADIEKLATTHDDLIDAETAARDKVRLTEQNHFAAAQDHANKQITLNNRANERNALMETINKPGRLQKRIELLENQTKLDKANKLVEMAQSALSQAFSVMQFTNNAAHQARAERKAAYDRAMDAKARLDTLNGSKDQFSSQNGLSMGR